MTRDNQAGLTKALVCRICSSAEWVAVWQEDAPEQAICIECCHAGEHEHANGETGHDFNRGGAYDVSSCIHCGMERPR